MLQQVACYTIVFSVEQVKISIWRTQELVMETRNEDVVYKNPGFVINTSYGCNCHLDIQRMPVWTFEKYSSQTY